jgi:hypothetical protein
MPSPAIHEHDAIGAIAAPMIDLEALDATPLQRDPFDFLVVPDFMRPDALAAAIADYPDITGPGNHKLGTLHYGPAFAALLDELESSALMEHLGTKFGVDLSSYPLTITIRRFCEQTDGHIHTDHRTKVVTMLVYLNEGWDAEGGRLRFLRSADDLEDYVAEATPFGGTMLAFRRNDTSFHGHKPHVGVRRMIQMNWVRQSPLERCEKCLNRMTKPVRRLLNVS